MQTIIIIIVVVIIIILTIILIVWFGPIYFFSIHRRKGSYLAYLMNWTIFLYIWKIFVLLSSAGLFPWCSNRPTIQSHTIRSKAFYSHFQKQIFLVTRFREKNKETACCFRIHCPSHDVLQELARVEHCRPLPRTRTKKPVATNGRREDYVRLPFVDDLCLRCAMQGFLRRKLSSKAKLTRRQIKSS